MGVPANSLDITQAGLVKFDGVSNFTGVTVTNHAVLIGATSNGITSSSVGATNTVLLGNTGADPTFGAVPNGALAGSGQITLSNGTNITISGSPVALGGTATVNVSGPPSATTLTSHGVLVGAGASAITATAAGSAGQVLQSRGAAADPSYSTATYPTTAGTSGNVITSDGTNFVSTTPSTAAGYTLNMLYDNGVSVASASTYYLSPFTGFDITGHGTAGKRLYIPEAGTITAMYGTFVNTAGNASAGNISVFLRKNNTTNTTVTSTLSLASSDNPFNNNALSISVAAGDYIEAFITTPVLVTGTISTSFSFTILVT